MTEAIKVLASKSHWVLGRDFPPHGDRKTQVRTPHIFWPDDGWLADQGDSSPVPLSLAFFSPALLILGFCHFNLGTENGREVSPWGPTVASGSAFLKASSSLLLLEIACTGCEQFRLRPTGLPRDHTGWGHAMCCTAQICDTASSGDTMLDILGGGYSIRGRQNSWAAKTWKDLPSGSLEHTL